MNPGQFQCVFNMLPPKEDNPDGHLGFHIPAEGHDCTRSLCGVRTMPLDLFGTVKLLRARNDEEFLRLSGGTPACKTCSYIKAEANKGKIERYKYGGILRTSREAKYYLSRWQRKTIVVGYDEDNTRHSVAWIEGNPYVETARTVEDWLHHIRPTYRGEMPIIPKGIWFYVMNKTHRKLFDLTQTTRGFSQQCLYDDPLTSDISQYSPAEWVLRTQSIAHIRKFFAGEIQIGEFEKPLGETATVNQTGICIRPKQWFDLEFLLVPYLADDGRDVSGDGEILQAIRSGVYKPETLDKIIVSLSRVSTRQPERDMQRQGVLDVLLGVSTRQKNDKNAITVGI